MPLILYKIVVYIILNCEIKAFRHKEPVRPGGRISEQTQELTETINLFKFPTTAYFEEEAATSTTSAIHSNISGKSL
jgi:hypothetical protein